MNILWITWKDTGHPEAGGAEIVCHELCKRLIADGHTVTLLTTAYKGAKAETPIKGLTIVRVGKSRYIHPMQALLRYVRHMRNSYDIVIEEVNGGAPYFAVFFGRKAKRFMLYHQLGRRNWRYEIPAPLSHVGYYGLVPIATKLASLARTPVITVSESTRQDLAQFGFPAANTHIISEGIQIAPLDAIKTVEKYSDPTVLCHGSMRAMKRTLDQIRAFEIAKQSIPNLQLKVSGSSSGAYGQKVLAAIAASPYKDSIEYLGRISDGQKMELMQRCHGILVTSIEEGWGLIVTEANSQGTPAVVYDVPGLRDSVAGGKTGIVTKAKPTALAAGIVQLFADQPQYLAMRQKAWEWSKQITFDQSYQDFKQIIGVPA